MQVLSDFDIPFFSLRSFGFRACIYIYVVQKSGSVSKMNNFLCPFYPFFPTFVLISRFISEFDDAPVFLSNKMCGFRCSRHAYFVQKSFCNIKNCLTCKSIEYPFPFQNKKEEQKWLENGRYYFQKQSNFSTRHRRLQQRHVLVSELYNF